MAVPVGDVNANRAAYTRALDAKELTVPFDVIGRTLILAKTRIDEVADFAPLVPSPAPELTDAAFEEQITKYLKSTAEWAPTDRPEPFERHLFRKKQRAKFFRGETS